MTLTLEQTQNILETEVLIEEILKGFSRRTGLQVRTITLTNSGVVLALSEPRFTQRIDVYA